MSREAMNPITRVFLSAGLAAGIGGAAIVAEAQPASAWEGDGQANTYCVKQPGTPGLAEADFSFIDREAPNSGRAIRFEGTVNGRDITVTKQPEGRHAHFDRPDVTGVVLGSAPRTESRVTFTEHWANQPDNKDSDTVTVDIPAVKVCPTPGETTTTTEQPNTTTTEAATTTTAASTTSTTEASSSTTSTTGEQSTTTTTGHGELPKTGNNSTGWALVGVGLFAAGTSLVEGERRTRRNRHTADR